MASSLNRRTRRASACALAADHAQLPALSRLGPAPAGFVSDLRFDPVGELLASCSTCGVVAVHQLHQFSGSLGAALAAAPDSHPPEDSAACRPIFKVTPEMAPRAVRWNPTNHNQLLCGLGQSGELLLYDLGGARPGRPARRLRSSTQHGVTDVDFLTHRALVVAGGRDGALRVWDTRSPGAVLRQSSQSSSWTLGVRTKDFHAGALNAVVGAPDGQRVHAATEEGCVLTWDVRALNAPQAMMRVSRAAGALSGGKDVPVAVEGLVPHPTLRHALAFQLAGGWVGLLDAEADGGQGALLSVCRLDGDSDPSAAETLPRAAGTHPPSRTAPAAAAAAAAATGIAPWGLAAAGLPFAAEAPALGRAPSVDWRVRARRPAWMLGDPRGDAWLCCGRAGAPAASLVRVDALCQARRLAHELPLSAPLVAAAQHPRGHFLAARRACRHAARRHAPARRGGGLAAAGSRRGRGRGRGRRARAALVTAGGGPSLSPTGAARRCESGRGHVLSAVPQGGPRPSGRRPPPSWQQQCASHRPLQVGLADNSVGLCMPLPTRCLREAAEAAEAARRAAEAEEEAARPYAPSVAARAPPATAATHAPGRGAGAAALQHGAATARQRGRATRAGWPTGGGRGRRPRAAAAGGGRGRRPRAEVRRVSAQARLAELHSSDPLMHVTQVRLAELDAIEQAEAAARREREAAAAAAAQAARAEAAAAEAAEAAAAAEAAFELEADRLAAVAERAKAAYAGAAESIPLLAAHRPPAPAAPPAKVSMAKRTVGSGAASAAAAAPADAPASARDRALRAHNPAPPEHAAERADPSQPKRQKQASISAFFAPRSA